MANNYYKLKLRKRKNNRKGRLQIYQLIENICQFKINYMKN